MRKGAYGAGILMEERLRTTVSAANTAIVASVLESICVPHPSFSLYVVGNYLRVATQKCVNSQTYPMYMKINKTFN